MPSSFTGIFETSAAKPRIDSRSLLIRPAECVDVRVVTEDFGRVDALLPHVAEPAAQVCHVGDGRRVQGPGRDEPVGQAVHRSRTRKGVGNILKSEITAIP